jgi:hypothetical protein
MSSAVFVQMNGLGFVFHSLIQSRMSRSSSVTLRWAERRSLRQVSSANQRSTRLSQDAEAGVKCRWKRGMPQQPLLDRLGLVGGVVVQDQVEFEVPGDGCVDDLQEAEELLVTVAAVVLGDDRAGDDVQGGDRLVVPFRT